MATFRKRGNKWRAEVTKNGVRKSASFLAKAQAISWAADIEGEIRSGSITADIVRVTFAFALGKYVEEISPTKRVARWEAARAKAYLKSMDFVGESMETISVDHIKKWRDKRLRSVTSGTVNRDLNFLSAVFEQSRREWKYCNTNPVRETKRPKNPRPRDRLITGEEVEAILAELKYSEEEEPKTISQRIGIAFQFAIETAMRAGEISSLTWDNVFLDGRYVHLDITKNGDSRNVPLSTRAKALLEMLPRNDDRCFAFSNGTRDTLFRRARLKAAATVPSLNTLKFHDTRHEAITRLARKLDVLDLARMIGHRDPKSLMIYYNATATDIASRLG
jgi:integrase